MVNLKTSKKTWIEAGLRMLAADGVEAVRAETLARTLSVTKGGFYGYFQNRAAFLDQLLAAWENDVTAGIAEQVESIRSGDPREKVRYLADVVSTADRPTRQVETELAIREWARRDPAVAEVVLRVDTEQAAFLRGLFRQFCTETEAEVRTAVAMSVRLSSHFIQFERVADAFTSIPTLIVDRLIR